MTRVLEVLSAVQFGIDGPHSGSDHRHSGAKASQDNGDQRIPGPGSGDPDLDTSDGDSRDWRPKAQEQEEASDGRNQVGKRHGESSIFNEMQSSPVDQNRACQYALKQKTSARPAFRKRGKETLQTFSPIADFMLVDR
jgi:hypothetical protein